MKFYRYVDNLGWNGVEVHLREYELVRGTRCGYWINSPIYRMKKDKWVSKTSRKRFAYPSKEEAMTNFIARKQRQICCLRESMERAKQSLILARAEKAA